MKSIKTILSLLSIMAILLLAACGTNEKKTTEETDTKTVKKSYTVEHSMGSTTIKGTPKRVVILTNEGTEALLSMGVTPVGAVQSFTGDPWYDHIATKMKDVKVVGLESEVNVE
ncbi:MAG: iron siderophore-binding protein, partial [Bacillus sp. (in: Bacteria)]|nr:iron siderophore-binding protein [Bacillus sp. (in: firmicutes)]